MDTDLNTTNNAWLDQLILELRLRDVAGDDIGDAVASAREFLADSGASADETFGTPGGYAEALGLAPADSASRGLRRTLIHSLIGLLGFFGVVQAAGPALRSEQLDISVSLVALVAMAVLLLLLTPLWLGPLVRAKPWKAVIVVAVIFAVQITIALSFGATILASVSALPIALVGSLLLIGTALWGQFRTDASADPIVDPLVPPSQRTRGGRIAEALPSWILCIAAIIFVGIDLILSGR